MTRWGLWKFRHPARLIPALLLAASFVLAAVLYKAGADLYLLVLLPPVFFMLGSIAAWLIARKSS